MDGNGIYGAGIKWIISSILYCSYNCILLIPMLVSLQNFATKRRSIAIIALGSGSIILFLGLSIFMLLTRCKANLATIEMPVLYVISKYFAEFRVIYAFIILASIYTTAISIGESFLQNFAPTSKLRLLIALILCTAGFIFSGFGFTNLVAILYPIFGYLGLIQISAIWNLRHHRFMHNFPQIANNK